jgi:hypothetical protein
MNERIKKLAEQAGAETWSRAPMRAVTGLAFTNENLQKFAELIINECIDQVVGTKIVGQLSGDKFAELSESADNKYTQWNNALVIATMNVRDHFGVKE